MPSITLETLRLRADFLRVQAAQRVGTATLVLHSAPCPTPHENTIRVGFTVTKRCGNAVSRNRIKRRLRALARLHLPSQGRAGTDYVLIGKAATATAPHAALERDLEYALRRIHRS